ncbi:MAG: NosD domain-containing protein, partial [Pyrobaculum sp.]
FNSTDVFIEGIRAAGSPQLPVYKRGVGLYVYNSTGVYVAGGLFEYFHDCIYVEYSREVSVRNVSASNCRYGVHVMFSVGVEVAWSKFWDNYVGVAVMYTHNATVLGVDSRGNRAWAEGYGYLLAEVSGRVANCTAADNVHGFYVLYWGGTRVVVSGCRVEGNYFGVTLRGRNATGVEFVGNVIGDNVVQVSHMGIGEAYANASFRGNLWGGHVSSGPYVYSSAFSDLMTATEGDLAFLAASSARPIIDALAARPIAYDPTPVPDQRLPSLLLAVALLPLVLIWKLR